MTDQSQQEGEAASSSATPRNEATMPATGAPEESGYVPDIKFDPQAVYAMIENSKWRKAIIVDGVPRWATNQGNGIGDKIDTDITWKMRQMGDVLYLAPKEVQDDAEDGPEASNNRRVEAFLDKATADLVAKSTKDPPPVYEELRAIFADNFDAAITLLTRDGVLATDVHGYIDNDFDNPGPRVNKETQFITRGYHSLMNRDKDPVFERLSKQLHQSLMPLGEDKEDSGKNKEEESGYESGGSAVSQDRCRESPAYPMCDDGCWLKRSASIPNTSPQPTEVPAKGLTLDSINLYIELKPGFTRVLTIAPGSHNEAIRCTLEPMEILGALEKQPSELIEAQAYEALSYTWGDATKCQIIECNGKTVGVSQNLFDALVNIRLLDKNRAVWIDALCINQEDNAEKSVQVRHMYAIYRAATRVIVWLGKQSDDSDFVMQGMAFVGVRKNRATIMRRDHHHDCLVQLARFVKGIDILTKRPWFSRSWIRQEIAAAAKVTVQCGSRQVPWVALKRSVNSITRLRKKYVASESLFNGNDEEFKRLIGVYKGESHALSFLKKDWVVGQSVLSEAGDLRSIWYYHTGGMLELLMAGRAYDATDARDKVYAILGMAEVPVNPRHLSAGLVWARDKKEPPVMEINYAASISEVYQHTAKYLVNRDENLDILCILPTHRDATSHELPSWVPDWRVSLASRSLYDNWDYISYKWGASGFTKAEAQDQTDLRRLSVTGFEIAHIQQLLPLYPNQLPHPPENPTGSAVQFEEGKHIRRFGQSTRGPAIVPSTAVVGDAIWILHGCRMPVVLRLVEAEEGLNKGAFEVIGPCYVSTLMFGEAVEWLEAGQHDLNLKSVVLI